MHARGGAVEQRRWEPTSFMEAMVGSTMLQRAPSYMREATFTSLHTPLAERRVQRKQKR